jgi:hypothetical protein
MLQMTIFPQTTKMQAQESWLWIQVSLLNDYYGLSKFIAVIFFIFSILFYTGKDS